MKTKIKKAVSVTKPFYIRRLARSGASRYLAVGTFLPTDWQGVKVIVEDMSNEGCTLRLIAIR